MAGAAARQDLTARDADVHADLAADLLAEGRHGVADRERGAHRALGIVVVRHGCAEHRHHAIADVFVHGAAEALDEVVGGREEAVGEVVRRLGPELMGRRDRKSVV